MNLRAMSTAISWSLLGALILWGIWPWLGLTPTEESHRTIVFYGFSILGETLDQSIFPEFSREWREKTGETVEFVSSFAGSGTVTNQVILGVPADLVLLSLEPDADRLAEAGVIPAGAWRRLPHGGVVNRTPFVILVRPGNPKGIHDFEDLTRPGVEIVHPDPLTSGGANWAILAEYGAGFFTTGPEGGAAMLRGIWKNVRAQAASARAARAQFENGFGDALITYEQEALVDRARGRLKADVVYPRRTILSEHLLVVVDKHVTPEIRPALDAFVAFLWSERAQRLFVERGFRSVEPALDAARADFGRIEAPFLVDDLGGWRKARAEIIEGVWKRQVLPELGR